MVEGKFCTGKRCYGMDRLTARLKDTSETQIHIIVLTMSLWKKLKSLFVLFIKRLFLQRLGCIRSWGAGYIQIESVAKIVE